MYSPVSLSSYVIFNYRDRRDEFKSGFKIIVRVKYRVLWYVINERILVQVH